VIRRAVDEAARFFDGDPQPADVPLACWSLVHRLASLIVDGRLTEEDAGAAEAIAARLTCSLADTLSALGEARNKVPVPHGTDRLARRMAAIGSD